MDTEIKEAEAVDLIRTPDLHLAIYPYLLKKDSENSIEGLEKHFKDFDGFENFGVHKYNGGYVIACDEAIFDARGFCVVKSSPLEGGKEAFLRARDIYTLV